MSLKGARVLVTGATGFIGSRVVSALKAAGAEVRAPARAEANLDEPASLSAAVKACDPEFAFHLAKPREGATFEREAKSTAALAAALAAGAPRLKRWVRTAHAASDRLGRGADAELARALAARHRLDVVTLELFLVYGPGERAGGFPRNLAEAALAGRTIVAPDEEKDLVFVDDVAQAYLAAATAPKAAGRWISIGGGRLIPGLETARAAARAAGREELAVAHPAAPRPGGHPADLKTARELLGWSPRTSLDEGMRQLVQWLREKRETRVD